MGGCTSYTEFRCTSSLYSYFGAMENWGAIFYFERDLLVDPRISTEHDKQTVYIKVTHHFHPEWKIWLQVLREKQGPWSKMLETGRIRSSRRSTT